MYKDLDNSNYDYIVLGTSVCESIFSSHLSKCGKKIIQFDISHNYGGDTKTLSFKDLDLLINDLETDTVKDPFLESIKLFPNSIKCKQGFFENEKLRDYNIDLNTKFIYSKSISTSSLANTNASNYMEFISVKQIKLLYKDTFYEVPSTKSDIFNSKFISLEEKQKLLNFIYSIIKIRTSEIDLNSTIDFGKDTDISEKYLETVKNSLEVNCNKFFEENNFSEKIQTIVKYVLANLSDSGESTTLGQLMEKSYKYLSSLQVYEDSPFLFPIYGSSEFAQALSRMSSVFATIFIVNECLSMKLSHTDGNYLLEVTDNREKEVFTVKAKNLIINETYLNCKNFKLENSQEFSVELKKLNTKFKLIYLFMMENSEEKRIEGPNFYIIPPKSELYNNDSPIIINEFCFNSYSTPRHRSMFKIEIYETVPEFEKLRNIFEIFVKQFTTVNPTFSLIYEIAFYQDISQFEYHQINPNNSSIITKNNYESFDLDFYYKQFERIFNEHQEIKDLTETILDNRGPGIDKSEENENDLIDELFNEFK